MPGGLNMEVRYRPPPVIVTVMIALMLYALFWPVVMRDVRCDYIPWLNHIIAAGPIKAFAVPFAAYNTPYLYLLALVSPLHVILSGLTLVKLVSSLGTIALALATFHLLKQQQVQHAGRWAALITILPTTVMNAALLGQSDALYAAPAILALSGALGRRHGIMLFWCGVSIAFKLQAILFAPFIIALMINRRVPLHYWLIPPAVFLASLVPAWAAGWPATELVGIYFGQAKSVPLLSLNAPNFWFIVELLIPFASHALIGTALVIAVGASAFYIFRFAVRMPDGNALFLPAILSILITAGLLPCMHERYFFFADIAALAFAVISGTRRSWAIALLIQAGSALATAAYVFSAPWLVVLATGPMIKATLMVIQALMAQRKLSSKGPDGFDHRSPSAA
jgi:Gpi18-like mannosyltransferase